MKDKATAGLFALLLGGIGAHRFYLGNVGLGVLYLFFFWTFIPAGIALIEGIYFLTMSEDAFNAKYNTPKGMQAQNIVVNVEANNHRPANLTSAGDSLSRLKTLHELHTAGALTVEEFEEEKRKVLGGSLYT